MVKGKAGRLFQASHPKSQKVRWLTRAKQEYNHLLRPRWLKTRNKRRPVMI